MNLLRIIWIYINLGLTKLLLKLGISKNKKYIPRGDYCYVRDTEKEKNNPHPKGGYWIKKCKYHKRINNWNSACLFLGTTDCILLSDSCKICDENIIPWCLMCGEELNDIKGIKLGICDNCNKKQKDKE